MNISFLKPNLWQRISVIVLLVFLSLTFSIAFRVAQSRSQSIHFVDEEDHIVFASYMDQGFRLYQDLSSNHQPVPYLVSLATQKISTPDNMFMLIKRHREVVFFYAFAWAVVITIRFGWVGLAFSGLFEFLKYNLLGNLLLAEPLATYPLIYIVGTAIEVIFAKYKTTTFDRVVIGTGTFIVGFSLVPLWPLLALITALLFLHDKRAVIWQISIALFFTLIMFLFINPYHWYIETIYNNSHYAIPELNEIHTFSDWLLVVFFPFQSFWKASILQTSYISFFLSLLMVIFVYFVIRRNRLALFFPLVYFILFLANNRVKHIESTLFAGFHLLPWLGLLIFLSFRYLLFLFREINRQQRLLLLPLGGWLLFLLVNPGMPYFWKTDVYTENYINYSNFDDFNYAVKSLASPQDRLAVLTSESLIYWNTGAKPATRQIVYYPWEQKVPELKKGSDNVFTNNPPEFLYSGEMVDLINRSYVSIRKNGNPTELFIRKDRLSHVTDEQKTALSARGFSLPESKD